MKYCRAPNIEKYFPLNVIISSLDKSSIFVLSYLEYLSKGIRKRVAEEKTGKKDSLILEGESGSSHYIEITWLRNKKRLPLPWPSCSVCWSITPYTKRLWV